MRALLVAALHRDHYDVVEVRDGWELLEYLTVKRLRREGDCNVDLVISDLRMPGFSGLNVLAGLRCADEFIPFILITAFGDPSTHREAHRLGAAAVFDKPFDLDALRATVDNLVA